MRVYKLFLCFLLCLLGASCQRTRTPIKNGYYYSSSENNKLDGMASVDLEYSEDGRRFVTVYRNLYTSSGDVIVHDKLAVFCVFSDASSSIGSVVVLAATPSVNPISIMPLIEKKRDQSLLPKAVDFKTNYLLTKLQGTDRGLDLLLVRRRFNAELPESLRLNLDWTEIKSLVEHGKY